MKRNNSLLGGILVIVGALLLASRFLFNSSFLWYLAGVVQKPEAGKEQAHLFS